MTIRNNTFLDDDTLADASNPFLKFVLPSIFALILLAGGVYWIKQLPASPPPSGAAGSIQVRLLSTPEVTPLPVQTADQPMSSSVGVKSEQIREQSDEEAENVPPALPAISTASLESPATPNVNALQASPSAPPNNVAVRFQQALMRHIERFQRYPGEARRDHLEGTVQVAFVMGRDGKILDAWIRSSSGQTVLDKEAVEALRRAEPLPYIPNELPGQLSVLLPVSFAAP
ncbi:MAG TPA: energy transducer TonB [Afipia sp.]